MNKTKIQSDIVASVTNPHGILLLAPRIGKTKLAIDIIEKFNPFNILWVTPSIKLRDIDIPEEFKKWKSTKFLKRTEIICWSSLADYNGTFDLVIFDEYQEITENNSRPFFNGQIQAKNILCLSGTHPEHKIKNDILKNLKLEVLYEITIDQAVEYGLIADYKINVIEVPLNDRDNNVEAGNKQKRFFTTEKKMYDYISSNISKMFDAKRNAKFFIIRRMHLIYGSKTKEEVAKYLVDNLQGRKLIFAGNIEQSKRLSPYTYNSKTDNADLDKFINGEIDILSCVKSGGVGFTYKDVDHLIIVQSDSDKGGETTQKLARSLLLQGTYVATIWIICLTGTQDEEWIKSALKGFNQSKIEYKRFINLKNESK